VGTVDERAREAFIDRYGHLVRYVVGRLDVARDAAFDREDATQAGLMGLLAARDAYRTDRGASFETYAILRIRGAILDAVRALDPVGRPARDGARAIARAASDLQAALGREPTTAEVAARAGLSVERYAELRQTASLTLVSLEAEDERTAGRAGGGLRDKTADPHAIDPGARAALNEELTTLVSEVALLGDRNRRVIALYYRDELTFREIASVLGVSESRACQIHRSALDGLRERLVPTRAQPVRT
jgi:RNA polymerase sigma factor for flagellar operon FliA